MKVSLQLDYAGNPVEAADFVVELEAAGVDRVWVPEAYGFDAPTLLGYLAARTSRVELATGILNIFSRTPGALLQTAAGLDSVSGGRAVLGLGASGPQVIEGFHGVPYDRPLARTRELVGLLRAGLRREPLVSDGLYRLPLPADHGMGLGKPLKLLSHPVRSHVPIWVAALGDKNVALAAELADGWLPFLFLPERAREVWGDSLAQGLARRSPDLPPLEIAAGGLVAIGDDVGHVLDRMRPLYALYVGGMGARGRNFYFDLACRYGFEAEAQEIQDLFLAGRREEAAAKVPRAWLEAANLVGPASYVRERIEAYRAAGVTDLQLGVLPGPRAAAMVSQVKEWAAG
jgi:probable F420-dependent oxidoreductase, Rv3520c family